MKAQPDDLARPAAPRARPLALLDGLFLAFGLAFLVLPALAVLRTPRESFPLSQERRQAAPWPELGTGAERISLALPLAFSRWFDDRIGFRPALLRAHAEIYLRVFHESPHHSVLFGKHGWLFQNAPEMVACARHLEPFDDLGLRRWQQRVEGRRDAAASVGGEYLLSFAPCKATLFPEELPASHTPLPGPTRVDEIFAHLAEHSDIHWIDVRPALRAAKEHDPIYSKTGLHWTDSGAYWGGYRPFLEELGKTHSGLDPVPRAEFREERPVDPHESLGLLLYLEDSFPAVVHRMRWPKAPRTTKRTIGGPGMLRCFDNPEGAPLRVLVLRDSFGTALLPLLSMHFRETFHFLPLRVPEPKILDIIREVRPDVVIDFMYETLLYTPEEILFTNLSAAKAKARQD